MKLESDLRPDILLFAESQSRFIVTVAAQDVGKASNQLRDAAIPFAQIGRVGGDRLKIDSMIDCSLNDLSAAYFITLHSYMDRPIEV